MIELHSIPSEQIVLSTLMSLEQIADTLVDQVDISDFYAGRHQIIFSHITDQHKKGESLDAVTIFELIKINYQEKEVSEQYLIELNNRITTTLMFETHLAKLKDLSARRRLQDTSKLISAMAVDMATHTAETAVSKAQSLIQNLDLGVGEEKLKHAHEFSKVAISEFIHRHQALHAGVPFDGGIRTGFTELDNKLGEVGKGDLVIIGARPSMGKTTFAQNLASDMMINQSLPVLFCSIEMRGHQIAQRLISGIGGVELRKVLTGKIDRNSNDFKNINTAANVLEKAPLMIDDNNRTTVATIRRSAKKVQAKYGKVGAIFVDYIQRVTPLSKNNFGRSDKDIGEISTELKRIAGDFDCPVFALAQLNRNLENRPNKRPVNADLKESGDLEQDADIIMFIYRDEVYNKESKDIGTAEIIIGKARNGSIGTVRLATDLARSTFTDLSPEYYESLDVGGAA
ncbi:replicative DNA helicase [Acinetobacter venetianus]|uniref:replicative DNA helicase n=1 Tax=Acinetobacter venetianus TaxID=52133 RepID=UPI000775883F|nr:replicative DNA helicase [Acinetobacter venetianus]KXO82678.1 replicative DNA helicase [Acinetobacter venetianus]